MDIARHRGDTFYVNGEPNGSMLKYMMILTSLYSFCVHLFICVLYDVKGDRENTSHLEWSNGFFPLPGPHHSSFFTWYNLGGELEYCRLVIGLLAIGYMIIGNYLPKEELDSKTNEIERKGRKQAGYLFIIGGLLLLVSLIGSHHPYLSFLILFVYLS